jgi:hypothetical protein
MYALVCVEVSLSCGQSRDWIDNALPARCNKKLFTVKTMLCK